MPEPDPTTARFAEALDASEAVNEELREELAHARELLAIRDRELARATDTIRHLDAERADVARERDALRREVERLRAAGAR